MFEIKSPLNCKSKAEMAYEALREAIISGEVKPGERVVLGKIAHDMGVSVIPVREAVKHLEAEGLLEVHSNEIVVSRLSQKDFNDLTVIRVLLEGYAAYLSAQIETPGLIKQLTQLIDEMECCIEINDFKTYGVLNTRFHELIYSTCGNEHLAKLIQSLTAKTDRARAVFAYDHQRVLDSLNEHKEIVSALQLKDSYKAKELIARQTQTSFDRFLSYYEGL